MNHWTLQSLVKKYSDFIEHPVVMDVEHKEGDETRIEEETLNAQHGPLAAQEVGGEARRVRRLLSADRQRRR